MASTPVTRTRLVYKAREHEYWLDGKLIPSCTYLMSEYGIGTNFAASRIPKATLERKRQIGSHVDAATLMVLEGTLDESTVAEPLQGYIQSFRRFLEAHSFVMETAQDKLFGELFAMFYGVTPDYTGLLDNRWALIDIKCTYDPSHFSWAVQTAAQKLAVEQKNARTDIERYVLWLQKDGTYNEKKHLFKYEDPEDITVFQSALYIHTQKNKSRKG